MEESRLEGYWMLVRLADGWASRRNRFLKHGEALFSVWHGRELVGVCGLNIDPYFDGREQGRVRHLFVSALHRRNGVGRMLVETVVDRARRHFAVLNTRAPQEAFVFYEGLGFEPVEGEEFVTHRMTSTENPRSAGKETEMSLRPPSAGSFCRGSRLRRARP